MHKKRQPFPYPMFPWCSDRPTPDAGANFSDYRIIQVQEGFQEGTRIIPPPPRDWLFVVQLRAIATLALRRESPRMFAGFGCWL